MNEDEIKQIISEIKSQLTGDPDHDADLWNEYGERYRGKPGSEPLLSEIARRIFALASEEDLELLQDIYDDMVETADEDYDEACRLIEQHQYDEAIGKLLVLSGVIRSFELPDDTIWMDFASYLDALVFQDLFEDQIGEKEIGRHPMHPAHILFTTGNLLIEMERAEEAVEILEQLVSYDPVCPRYLFELGEAYKRTGNYKEAAQNAIWSLSCASNRAELARGYRDLAFCHSETGAFEDALILYLLSLRYEDTSMAEAEIAWIAKKTGIRAESYTDAAIRKRCEELNIPIGISETVLRNQEFLKIINESDEE